jgi:uncharacterized membrane protein
MIKISEKGVAYLFNSQEDIKKYNTDIFTISRGMVNVMAGIKGIDIWANFTEEEKTKYEIASTQFAKDEAVIDTLSRILTMTLLILTFGILFAILIVEFFVPLIFNFVDGIISQYSFKLLSLSL